MQRVFQFSRRTGLGALWSLWLPLNKNLWTPSFVPSLAYALAFVALWWPIVWAMDGRRIYLKL